MNRGKWSLSILFCLMCSMISAQRIVYSEPERDDTRRMNFDIIGKIEGNFLIYKSIRNSNSIALFDNDMKQVARTDLDFLPNYDRMINVDFFPYGSFFYMIYQYQKRNIVYCAGVKLDATGKKISDVMELDTTRIGLAANNKIYTVLSSEDKSKLIVFKINSKNKRLYYMTTMLYDQDLRLLKKSRLNIPMEERNNYLNEFHLDNTGDLVFSKISRGSNDNIGQASFVIKPSMEDTLLTNDLNIQAIYLDEIRIKIDNFNNRYFLTSFYYKQRRGNIDGFYFFIWDKNTGATYVQDTVTFNDDLRKEARGESSTRMAFNDYFLRNIIIKRSGGFLIASESYYTTSRYGTWNRWDYLYGYPFASPWGYYYYSPYYNNLWWNSRYYNSTNVRYHADNIAVLSFDSRGKMEWANVIGKSQFNDQSDDDISYQLMNTGDHLHFLFNNMERKTNLLNDYTISPDGQLNHNPTLKNLDRGYEFMPKYGKQVSAKQTLIPCIHRNLICFAKIDYN